MTKFWIFDWLVSHIRKVALHIPACLADVTLGLPAHGRSFFSPVADDGGHDRLVTAEHLLAIRRLYHVIYTVLRTGTQ